MEDELRDAASFVGFLAPRPLRVAALAAGALAAGIALGVDVLAGREAAQLAIDAGGCVALSVVAVADSQGAGKRRKKRADVRLAQIAAGDRVPATTPDGRRVTKLKPVDADWVCKRLEKWGRSEALPMLSPQKAGVLERVVADAAPKAILHVGSLLGYSTIRMCTALPDGGQGCRLVALERDPTFFVASKRFVHQARLDGWASSFYETPHRADVVMGDATDAAVVTSAARLALEATGRPAIDLLYLAGAPSEYVAYLRAAEPFLAPGSMIVADHAKVAASFMASFFEAVESGPYQVERVACPLEWSNDTDEFLLATRL